MYLLGIKIHRVQGSGESLLKTSQLYTQDIWTYLPSASKPIPVQFRYPYMHLASLGLPIEHIKVYQIFVGLLGGQPYITGCTS